MAVMAGVAYVSHLCSIKLKHTHHGNFKNYSPRNLDQHC
jgi:hypothetical protein